jgi:hypothetical protein
MVEFPGKRHTDFSITPMDRVLAGTVKERMSLKPYALEPIIHGRKCAFGRISAPPKTTRQLPADLDTRSEVRFKRDGRETDATCKGSFSGNLQRPFAETRLRKFRLDFVSTEG